MVRTTLNRRQTTLVLCALTLAGATGFSTPALFPEPVQVGGGGGRFFTGAPRDGFGCDVCHLGEQGPSVEVSGVPAQWSPGATYTLSLRWEHALGATSFVGELVDTKGHAVGELATPPPDLIEEDERCGGGNPALRVIHDETQGRTVVAASACGARAMRVQWTAPSAEHDTGPISLYMGLVHGDDSDDPAGDQVRMGAQTIHGPDASSSGGCRTGPTTPPGWTLLPLLWARRRRRDHRERTNQ